MSIKTILIASILALSFYSSIHSQELKILCWEGYASEEYLVKFKELIKQKYNIDLRITVNDVSDPYEFYDKIRSKEVDLISPAQNIPKSDQWNFIKKKLVVPINLDNIPNYKDIIPALKKTHYISVFDNVYGVPIVYGPYGLAYNTNIIKEEPKSWNILWDPRYKNKYSVSSDYHEANIYISALALGYDPNIIFNYNDINTIKLREKLKNLAVNANNFWVGVDSAEKLRGLALATAWGFSFPELQRKGDVWKMAQPKEGVTGWVDNWMIGYSLKSNPELKRIAEEWINFSIGPFVQVGYVRNIAQFPVNLKIKNLLTEKEVKNFHLDDPNYFKNNLILWQPLRRRDQNGFKNLWEDARDAAIVE